MVANELVENVRAEYVYRNSGNKTTYNVKIENLGIDIKSKEVFKNEDKTVVFPFRVIREEYSQKYLSVQKIIFEGFNGKFPKGTRPTVKTGYGLTNRTNHIIYFIEKNFKNVDTFIISKNKKTGFSKKTITFSALDFENLRAKLSVGYNNLIEERKCLINNFFAENTSGRFVLLKPEYKKGTLSNLLNNKLNLLKKLSAEDKESLQELFKKLRILKKADIDTSEIITTKMLVDSILIEDVTSKFDALLKSKRRNEEKWQVFFQENAWIFSQIFSYPAVLFEDKAYVGGTRIDNKDGKIADFLYQNDLTKNIAIVEIKTPVAKLVKKEPYRGDDVFAIESELNGAINQVLNQKDNLQVEYYGLKAKSDKEFYSFNPKCFIVIGKISGLSKNQVKSFELFRHSCNGVEIITFDELYERINKLLKIFTKKQIS